ncbi:C-type mannose receptor 2-like [Neocloeon triangulifer]|uniref:C-type mannose receptor 2-like n=1 Tax=Neocloeon triangulifer TaxID=2078957 RepID=UPI00286F469A|nr:C-type mannose receptor 2-like [Neocloeon triangulifer]
MQLYGVATILSLVVLGGVALFGVLILTINASSETLCEKAGKDLNMTKLVSGTYFFKDDFSFWISWDDAKAFCESHGLELLTVTNRYEAAEITDVFETYLWTSGYFFRDGENPPGQFKWQNGSIIPLDSAMWSSFFDEPNHYLTKNRTCVLLYRGELLDDPCVGWYPFACEIPHSCYS